MGSTKFFVDIYLSTYLTGGVVMTLYFGEVLWFNPGRGYGAARLLQDNSEIGIHRDRGRIFYRGTDRPELRLSGRLLAAAPEQWDRICLIPGGKSRAGKPCSEVWGKADDFDMAERDIQERDRMLLTLECDVILIQEGIERQRQQDRLACNPKFQLVEAEYLHGKPTSKPEAIRFEGTRDEFRTRQNDRSKPPLITTNGKVVVGYQYLRFWRQETADGWHTCDNPMTLTLPPMPPKPDWKFLEACYQLRGTQIRKAPWIMAPIGFLWYRADQKVAHGNCEGIFICEDDLHTGTWIHGAEAEYLWEQADRSGL